MTVEQALMSWADWRFNGSRSEPLTPMGYAAKGSAAGGGGPDLSGLRGYLAVEQAIDHAVHPIRSATERMTRRSALVQSLRKRWHDGWPAASADHHHICLVVHDAEAAAGLKPGRGPEWLREAAREKAVDDQFAFDEELERLCGQLAEEARQWLRLA